MRSRNRVLIALMMACLASGVMRAQEVVRTWDGSEALGAWIDRNPRGTASTEDGGIVVNVSPANRPNSINSPKLNIKAADFTTVRLSYFAEIQASEPQVMLVGWLDNLSNEDRAADCAIPVTQTLGQWATVDVDFSNSPCWNPTSIVQYVAINVSDRDFSASGRVHIRSIQLMKSR